MGALRVASRPQAANRRKAGGGAGVGWAKRSVPTAVATASSGGHGPYGPLPTLLHGLDRRPSPLRRCRHVDMRDTVSAAERIDDGVHHRRAGADRSRLAGALDAEGVGLRGDVAGLELEARHPVGAWHG